MTYSVLNANLQGLYLKWPTTQTGQIFATLGTGGKLSWGPSNEETYSCLAVLAFL